jgi:hypothetical protein
MEAFNLAKKAEPSLAPRIRNAMQKPFRVLCSRYNPDARECRFALTNKSRKLTHDSLQMKSMSKVM